MSVFGGESILFKGVRIDEKLILGLI